MDTTSNALSRILHLPCQHQDTQDKLRAEIRCAVEQYSSEIPCDELSALRQVLGANVEPYLDGMSGDDLQALRSGIDAMRRLMNSR